ncbi:hypothetical protein [Nostoc sp. TCL240-02]|uniref:hypothetical protein n=1 Tax=Nostoc sp. TCL240-02 TaxID=2572090 RepID=UPI00157F97BF|nr:hypothetical protein [Nostoc sp. TCL240-02]
MPSLRDAARTTNALLATIRLCAAGTRFSCGDVLRTDLGGMKGLRLRQKLQ